MQALGPFPGAQRVSFEAVLDTAAPAALRLPGQTARRVRPWLRTGPHQVMASPFGETHVYAGAVLELTMGSMTAGPVQITMEDRKGVRMICLSDYSDALRGRPRGWSVG